MENKYNPEIPVEKEYSPEQIENNTEGTGQEGYATAPQLTTDAPVVSPKAERPAKSPQLIEIEGILSEGLDQAYMSMAEDKKQAFRRKGEETARSIQALIQTGKAKVGRLRTLIISWLKLIPGVNKFFLEQEAKIKADRLMMLQDK